MGGFTSKSVPALTVVLLVIFLVSCAQGSALTEKAQSHQPVTKSGFTQAPTTTPAASWTPEPTATVIPTETIEPTTEADSCNHDQALKIIARIDEIIEPVEETPSPEETGEAGEDWDISEAQRLLIEAAFTKTILELELMNVPDCLSTSVDLLKETYVYMRDLFSGSDDRPEEEVWELLYKAGETQGKFDEEYARAKACILNNTDDCLNGE